MLIDDRIGFACTFLSDADLVEYICQLTDQVYEKGDISGILLTGKAPPRPSLRKLRRRLVLLPTQFWWSWRHRFCLDRFQWRVYTLAAEISGQYDGCADSQRYFRESICSSHFTRGFYLPVVDRKVCLQAPSDILCDPLHENTFIRICDQKSCTMVTNFKVGHK